jgi:hypothetical protein
LPRLDRNQLTRRPRWIGNQEIAKLPACCKASPQLELHHSRLDTRQSKAGCPSAPLDRIIASKTARPSRSQREPAARVAVDEALHNHDGDRLRRARDLVPVRPRRDAEITPVRTRRPGTQQGAGWACCALDTRVAACRDSAPGTISARAMNEGRVRVQPGSRWGTANRLAIVLL